MAKISFPGLEEYERRLSTVEHKMREEIIGKAIYVGAGIVADKIRQNINALPAVNDIEGAQAWRTHTSAPLTKKAKKGLQDSIGITKLRDHNGYFNVKIGFDGYNGLKTKKYPKGQPNVMVARYLEKGSSIADKRPFIRPAIRASRAEAEKKMAEVIDSELKKIMEDKEE